MAVEFGKLNGFREEKKSSYLGLLYKRGEPYYIWLWEIKSIFGFGLKIMKSCNILFDMCENKDKKKVTAQEKTVTNKMELLNEEKKYMPTKDNNKQMKYTTIEKNVNIQSFLNFMQKFTSFLPVWHDNGNGNFTLKSAGKPFQKQEKLISSKLYYHQSFGGSSENKIKTYDKLQFVRDILKYRNLEEDELKRALQICASSLSMLQTVNREGKVAWFESNAKGTKRYCKIQQGKILDFVEERRREKKDCVFLTLTCDPKKYASRSVAWKFYLQEEVYRVTENLRKHYDAEYVATLESTAKGYPHIHMMLFFPHNTFPELKYYHNQQNIRKGSLYDMVCHTVNSEVFNLQSAKGKNLKWYLTKYIGKGVENDVFSLLDKKGSWKLSDVKQVQEYIYLKAFNRRKLLMTRKGCKKRKEEEEKIRFLAGKKYAGAVEHAKALNSAWESAGQSAWGNQDQVGVLLQRIRKMPQAHATKLREHLTRLCTNSPSWKDCHVESLSFEKFVEHFKRVPDRNNDVKQEEKKTFSFHGRVMVDSRNFIEDFMRFVMSPLDSDINRKRCVDIYNDNYSRMLDSYDLSDDRQFLMAVFKVFCYYVENILVKGVEYREVLQKREIYTKHKKLQYVGKGEFATHICANTRESYYKEDEYEEIRYYVDMKTLRFRKGVNQYKILEYLKKYKLIAGIV